MTTGTVHLHPAAYRVQRIPDWLPDHNWVSAAAAPVLKSVCEAHDVGAAPQCSMQGGLTHADAVAVCAASLQALQARIQQREVPLSV
jgi:hypothetical protein